MGIVDSGLNRNPDDEDISYESDDNKQEEQAPAPRVLDMPGGNLLPQDLDIKRPVISFYEMKA